MDAMNVLSSSLDRKFNLAKPPLATFSIGVASGPHGHHTQQGVDRVQTSQRGGCYGAPHHKISMPHNSAGHA